LSNGFFASDLLLRLFHLEKRFSSRDTKVKFSQLAGSKSLLSDHGQEERERSMRVVHVK
jgi:hypothetical protein